MQSNCWCSFMRYINNNDTSSCSIIDCNNYSRMIDESALKQNRESTEGYSKNIVRKITKKDWSQQVEHMQVPKGTGPGIRRSKRPLSACHTRRKCASETYQKLVKGLVRWSGHRTYQLQFIFWKGLSEAPLKWTRNFFKNSLRENISIYDQWYKLPEIWKK